jgi:hypothetical protein
MALHILGEATGLSLYAVSAHCVAKLLNADEEAALVSQSESVQVPVRSCQRLLSMTSANFYVDELVEHGFQATEEEAEDVNNGDARNISLRSRLSQKGYPLLVQIHVILMMDNLQEAIVLASKMEKCDALLLEEKKKAYQLIFDYLVDTDKLFIDKTTPVEKSLLLSFAPLVGPVGMHVFEQSYHLLSKQLPQGLFIVTELERKYVWFASHQTLLKLMIAKYTLEKALKRFQAFKSLEDMPFEQQKQWTREFLAVANDIPPSLAIEHAGGVRAGIGELMTRGTKTKSPVKESGGDMIEIEDDSNVLVEEETANVEEEEICDVDSPVELDEHVARTEDEIVEVESATRSQAFEGDGRDLHDSEQPIELDYDTESEQVDEDGSERPIEVDSANSESDKLDGDGSELAIEVDENSESDQLERPIDADENSESDQLDDDGSELAIDADANIESDELERPIDADENSESDQLDDDGSELAIEVDANSESDQLEDDGSERPIEVDDDSQSDQLDGDSDGEDSERPIEVDDDSQSDVLAGDGSERPIEVDEDSQSDQLDGDDENDEGSEHPIKAGDDSQSDQLDDDDDASERLIEVGDDSDSEQDHKGEPPTAQSGDDESAASGELEGYSDHVQAHNDDAGHPDDYGENMGHSRREEIESGRLDREQNTSPLRGQDRLGGDETADEESVAAIFMPEGDSKTGRTGADALEPVIEEEESVEMRQNHSNVTNDSPSRVEAGYEAEDSQDHTGTEEEEEVSEAMHTEDEEEERHQVGASRLIPSAARDDACSEQAIRRPDSNLSDMDAADEMTTEHEDDLGGESSEEMADPHMHFAPYAPSAIAGQARVSLHDYASFAQRQDETQRGNFPTMPSPSAVPPRTSVASDMRTTILKARA